MFLEKKKHQQFELLNNLLLIVFYRYGDKDFHLSNMCKANIFE